MFNLSVKGKQPISGHEIPIIEGNFGQHQRMLMAKTVADFHGLNTFDVNKLINSNLDKLIENQDYINVRDLLMDNKELREELGLKSTEVNKNTKYVYVLSERGYIKLVSVMSNNNEKKIKIMQAFITNYFQMKSYLEEVAIKPLSQKEINEILKLANQNPYIKDYIKILVPPRGKLGKEFKDKEINKFLGKINYDIERYLISSLGVRDLEHIPEIAHKSACFLVRECYSLPENLRSEFYEILQGLLEVREKVINENQLKNAKVIQSFKLELEKIKTIIRGYLE